MAMIATVHPPETPLFEAVIVPHRSLSRRGTLILVGAMCSLGLAVTVVFTLLGAWPVAGFDVIDVALAVLLLRINGRARRASETLTLTDRALHVVRRDPDGRQTRRSLPPGWLNAVLEERQGRVPALWLVARNAREEVAAALGETEKRDLAASLRAALHRSRNPVFDNPQLRDDTAAAPDPHPAASGSGAMQRPWDGLAAAARPAGSDTPAS
jgi:uncharacterized membrane protein